MAARCRHRVLRSTSTAAESARMALVLLIVLLRVQHGSASLLPRVADRNSTVTTGSGDEAGVTSDSNSNRTAHADRNSSDNSSSRIDSDPVGENGNAVSLGLQVSMLLVVFIGLLVICICCSFHSLCRRWRCCRGEDDDRETSFDMMTSRSASGFREDLLNDEELLRLWICWYCDFANYEMKTQCALCGMEKKEKRISQHGGDKPSAVRPASLLGSSFAATALSCSSDSSSFSGLASMSIASPPQSHYNPSLMVHTPLEPLPESPSTNHSGIDISTPPGSPPSDHAILTSFAAAASPRNHLSFTNSVNSLNSNNRIRRKEWLTKVDDSTSKIVWTRNADCAGATSSSYNSIATRSIGSLSATPPSSFSSSLPSPSSTHTDPIVRATAFVSRNNVSNPVHQQQQPHSMIHIEPAENAEVYASLRETDPKSLSCGINPHALEPIRNLSFPEKHRWFMQETSSLLNARWDNPIMATEMTLLMPRDDLMRATVHGLMRVSQKQLHRPLRVQFKNEPGVDAGGIVREWFGLVVAEFLNDNTGLFQCVKTSEDGVAYTINQNASIAVDECLLHFRAFGRLLGKALLEGHLVSAPLTDVVFKHILSAPISFADLQSIDARLAHSLQLLWETPLTEGDDDAEEGDDPYALDFSIYHTAMGTVDLKPNGRDIIVTEKNKHEYVTLFVQWHLANSVSEEIGALVTGIYDVLPVHLLAPFDYKELRLLLCGSPKIDLNDWEENTVVAGKKTRATSRLVQWFWRIVRSLTVEEQGHILQFATGSARVPIQGFKALTASDGRLCPFTINCLPRSDCPGIRAYTCFNRLDLPVYRTEKELDHAIRLLLQIEATGFSIQ